jgi:Porin subfamily
MTLIKSLLLGSAAGIVAVASAQAADLPTKKAAPVEYVRICNVGGITGWTLPGSDTCVKFSGYITAQFEGGNLETEYNWGSGSDLAPTSKPGSTTVLSTTGVQVPVTVPGVATPIPGVSPALAAALSGLSDTRQTQRVLIAGNSTQQNTTNFRDQTGWTTRANFGFDMASNTAYGPLIGHFDLNAENGQFFDNTGTSVYINTAYLTWAGITAGKQQSFFSFTGGGDNWANFFSPDRKGFNEPELLAYTASFGGGFSATLSAETPGSVGGSGSGTDMGGPNNAHPGGNEGPLSPLNTLTTQYEGQRWPDFVGALHVKQGWGEAQVSGVIHNVNVFDNVFNATSNCGLGATTFCNGSHTQVGWAIDAGVKINLPSFGAGDNFLVTGEYGQSATWYSGLTGEAMWGEWGQTNGNGQPMFLPDAFFNPLSNSWSKPTTWSVSGLFEHHFTPQFYVDLEGSVGGFSWSNMGGGCNLALPGCLLAQAAQGPLSPNGTAWLIGADLGWNPVTNLNFDLELMYMDLNQARPSGFLGTIYNFGEASQVFVPGDWKGNSNGFAGRFRITRYF